MNAPEEPAAPPPRVLVGARRAVAALALAWALGLAALFAARLTYPLELEWMEGGSLHHALRLLRGEAIYAAPSIDFVPFLYTPLYPALLALLAGLGLPLGLALGRALSVAAIAAIAGGLWRLTAAEGKPRAHRAAAIGLFLAGYVFTYRWYDLARADALMLALLLWGLILLRRAEGAGWRPLVAGVLVAMAFWTKQTAAVMILASGVGGLALVAGEARGRRRARLVALALYTATVAALVLGGLAIGDARSEGWLWTYVFELHQRHPFNAERFSRKSWGMLLHSAPSLALLLGGLVGGRVVARVKALAGRRPRVNSASANIHVSRDMYWGAIFVAALLASALGYSTLWAEANAFIPAVLFGAAYLAVALPVGGRGEVAALALIALQLLFAALVEPTYQPIQERGIAAIDASYRWQELGRSLPDAGARARASALRAELLAFGERRGPGPGRELLALQRPWWSVLAGGPGHVGSMGLNDVAPEDQRRLQGELRAALAGGRFAAIWLEGEPPTWLRPALAGAFQVARRLHGDARVRPWTGYLSEAGMVTPYRGDQLYLVPCAARPPPAGARLLADFERGGSDGFRRSGAAFGRAGQPALSGDLPALGPHGGAALLGSAARRRGLAATGEARSPAFVAPAGAVLELLVGVSAGDRGGLLLFLEAADDPTIRAEMAPPATPAWALEPLRWPIPAALSDRPIHLVIRDESANAAIFVDDVWLIPGAG